jgi:Domain of unknown function (DUF4396)
MNDAGANTFQVISWAAVSLGTASRIEFWFMMQAAMACGFLTAYPMNWLLIKTGVKTAM